MSTAAPYVCGGESVFWWSRRRAAVPDVPADPVPAVETRDVLDAVREVQADVRRLGAATVRAETGTQALAARLDLVATGLERVARQSADAEAMVLAERVRVLERFFDLGDALARAWGVFAQGASDEERAAAGGLQRAAGADALERLYAQFMRVVEDLGCEPVAAPGASFDPQVHRAVARVEQPAMAGRVVLVARAGWRLGGRVLRVADVVVAMGATGAGAVTDSGEGPERVSLPSS